MSSEYPSGHREMVKVDIDEESYHLEVRQEDEKCHSGLKRKSLLFSRYILNMLYMLFIGGFWFCMDDVIYF